MSAVGRREPTSRQLNEAARIATRFGRSEWLVQLNGTMVIRCWGDNPEPDEQPLVITLDRLGLVLNHSGSRRREVVTSDDE